MPVSQVSKVIQHLHKTMLVQEAADGQLLEAFVSRQEKAALEVLVRRHGPMVWGVCRRILGNHHDAEDAFQATFLVLVRRAASIVPREMVANWLHGVAHQTALKARATASKRKQRERQLTVMPETTAMEQNLWSDLQPLLDQELKNLPDKYRAVILLCDLDGKTRKEAAQHMGCPEGTIATRLTRGRVLLAKRLARHGLAVSGGSLAVVLAQQARAGVPELVISSAINAVIRLAAGQGTTLSATVITLMEGVLKTMLLTKLRTMLTTLLVLGLSAFGAGLVHHRLFAGQENSSAAKTTAAPLKVKNRADPNAPAKDFKNDVGMKFVWIPPGNFLMGSPTDERGRNENEVQHKVTLTRGFYMAVYTVTQKQWKQVMAKNPSVFAGNIADDLPVESVSWNDCQEFIKKLREKDKKPYRLPTEAEWEYACRAGTTTPFHFGKTISPHQANYNGANKQGDDGACAGKTLSVGSFPANAWGLHDMHGNVWQWCQDWFGDYPRKDVVDPHGPDHGALRVLRGGSWIPEPEYCRSAFRNRVAPGVGNFNIGFRLCFGLEQPRKNQGGGKESVGREQKNGDTEKLQGTWKLVMGGLTEYPDVPGVGLAENIKNTDITIDGDQWTGWTIQGKKEKTTFRLDATKTPKTLAIKDLDGSDALGIYNLGGDNLVIVIRGGKAQERPPSFVVDSNTVSLLIYKRARNKGDDRAKPTTKDAAETELDTWLDAFYEGRGWPRAMVENPDLAKKTDELQGAWTLVSCKQDGKVISKEKQKLWTEGLEQIIFFGKTCTWVRATKIPTAKAHLGMEYRSNSAKEPKRIDLVPPTGQGEGAIVAQWIYSLDGDELRIGISTEAVERPATFDMPKTLVLTFRRTPA